MGYSISSHDIAVALYMSREPPQTCYKYEGNFATEYRRCTTDQKCFETTLIEFWLKYTFEDWDNLPVQRKGLSNTLSFWD